MSAIPAVSLNLASDVPCATDMIHRTRERRSFDEQYAPGGADINVARVIPALGGDAEAFFLAGGETGEMFDRLLHEQEVDCRRFPLAGVTRICSSVFQWAANRVVPETITPGSPLRDNIII